VYYWILLGLLVTAGVDAVSSRPAARWDALNKIYYMYPPTGPQNHGLPKDSVYKPIFRCEPIESAGAALVPCRASKHRFDM